MSLRSINLVKKLLVALALASVIVIASLSVSKWLLDIGLFTINGSIDNAQDWFDAQTKHIAWIRFVVYAAAIIFVPKRWSTNAGRLVTVVPVLILCLAYEIVFVHRLGL